MCSLELFYLDNWPGALVVSTHDRYLLERVCSDVFSVQPDGSIRHHPGGWAAYRAAEIDQKGPGTKKEKVAKESATDYSQRLSSNEQHELRQIEKQIPKLERKAAAAREELDSSAHDWERAAELGDQLTRFRNDLAGLEDRWLELSERG